MPNIPSFPRGLAETVKTQVSNIGQNIKSGALGEDQQFTFSEDVPAIGKTFGKNVGQYGTFGGAVKTLYDLFKSGQAMQPTSNVGQLAQYDFGGDQFGTSPISTNPFAPTQYDMSGMMKMIDTPINNMFQTPTSSPSQRMFTSGSMPRSSMIQNELPINDIVNKIEVPTDSGLQMPQEQQAQPQVMDNVTVTAPPQQRITPKKMPMPSDLDYIFGANQSAYQSRSAPSYVNPMTVNKGYFDMNKAGTVGGNYIPGVGWYNESDKMFGLKKEDLIFNRQMQDRIASMFQ